MTGFSLENLLNHVGNTFDNIPPMDYTKKEDKEEILAAFCEQGGGVYVDIDEQIGGEK